MAIITHSTANFRSAASLAAGQLYGDPYGYRTPEGTIAYPPILPKREEFTTHHSAPPT